MVPTSRNGGGSEFNLFPYDKKAHRDYHFVLSNLKINQVWNLLDEIHRSIFESGEDYIKPWWYEFCELENGTLKQKESFAESKRNALESYYADLKADDILGLQLGLRSDEGKKSEFNII